MSTIDLGYFSHAPILGAMLAHTSGPVLELGAGDVSTTLIHYACHKAGRYACTAESDPEWLMRYAQYNKPGVHDFHLVNGKDMVGKLEAWDTFCQKMAKMPHWGVCFVDQAPGEARLPSIMTLKENVLFFVVHDFEADEPPGGGNYGWKHLVGAFKYISVMKRIRPWTAILSDHYDLELEEMDTCPTKSS